MDDFITKFKRIFLGELPQSPETLISNVPATNPGKSSVSEEERLKEKVKKIIDSAVKEGVHDLVYWIGTQARHFSTWKSKGNKNLVYLDSTILKVRDLPIKMKDPRRGVEITLPDGILKVSWWDQRFDLPDGDDLHYNFYRVDFNGDECASVKYRHTYDLEYDVSNESFETFESLKQGVWIEAVRKIKNHYDTVLKEKMEKNKAEGKKQELEKLKKNFDV